MRSDIITRMEARAPHGVWTPNDFVDLGSRSAVDMALSRLAAGRQVRRVARGLYDRPRLNRLTGRVTSPSPNEIVEAVARRDGLGYVVDGMTAANDLGFDDAVPSRVVVHTSSRLAPVRVGDLEIEFKLTLGPRMFWAGRPAMRMVQALDWLKDRLPRDREAIERRIGAILRDAKHGAAIRGDLVENLHVLPTWMQDLLRPLLEHGHEEDRDAGGPKP